MRIAQLRQEGEKKTGTAAGSSIEGLTPQARREQPRASSATDSEGTGIDVMV